MRQRRLSEAEIQTYEKGDEEQLAAYFATLTGAQVGVLFIQLLRSYRDAARVANASWVVLDESKKNGHPSPATYKRLTDALQKYAPMNFPPTKPEYDAVVQALAAVCDTMSRFSTVGEAWAWIVDYANRFKNARWHEGGNT
jgi:hypothetical protein